MLCALAAAVAWPGFLPTLCLSRRSRSCWPTLRARGRCCGRWGKTFTRRHWPGITHW